jgi:signal transduction histidine kinase/CheY-like chemotaxis protein
MLGFALVAALGLWVAWRLSARISQPIAALAAAAPALGRGEASALPDEGLLEEVQELSRALGDAARAVRDREERQRRAEQALRDAERAKDEFLAMLGHELRNPLASVSNAAHLLRIARDQPEVLQTVSEILARQVEHMTRLVDDLLEVGRVTGGKVRLERAPLNLGHAAGELIATWKSGERFRHHRLETALDTAWVSADRARIEQVLSNLLDNALKYTPAGGTIRVAVRAQAERAVLEVSDDGEGIAPELLGRMFDLFVQGERGLARQRGGLGIGLTMAKRLVELHEGTIRAASAGPGRGATITVELPATEAPALRAADKPAPAAPAPRRVLVIEDNADGRETLAALLRLWGHEVHGAEDGARGLEAAARLRPQLALVDIGLPDIDGYEIARRLRADPAMRGMRLVALTGYGMAEDRRRALAAGFDEHLAKPVEPSALEALLRSLPAAA